ncbi:MAG: glycosyltransferase family 4 protein [Candidatus Hodarchaeales archaeon]|jgi:glycosyltransferase involved in cell wall biosynthesis
MIRIFEHSIFLHPSKLSEYTKNPIDRNRTLIASRLPSKKFLFLAFSNDEKFNDNITLLPMNKLWPLRLYRFKADIIHTKLIRSCLRTVKIVRLSNNQSKHIVSVHGFPETWRIDPKEIKAYNKLIDDADVIHAVSKVTAREIEEEWGKDSVVIYNGIDTKLFHPKENNNGMNKLRALFIGRLVSHKHPEVVIDLAKSFPEVQFSILGQGEMYTEINEEAKRLTNVNITLIPYSEIPEFYRHHDIFLFPSEHEGFSNALLEALASGLPTIARNSSSNPEVIKNNHNGFLCDSLENIKDRFADLLSNPEKRQKMAINARKSVFPFDWNNIVKEYENTFEKMVS